MRGALALILVLLAAPAWAAGPLPPGARSAFVTVSDGARIHYDEMGQGSPVILLHGLSGTGYSNWVHTGIMQALAERHRVIVPDFRGQGDSQVFWEPKRYAADRFPRDILDLMDALGIRKAHFAGYSFGGEMEAPLLSLAPERILTMTFGGSGLIEPDPARDAAAAALDPKGHDIHPPPLYGTLWGKTSREVKNVIAQGRLDHPPTTPPFDPRKVTFPVEVIVGEFGRVHRLSSLMARTLPDFHLVVLPGREHGSELADPLFRETLVAFIDSHDTGAGR